MQLNEDPHSNQQIQIPDSHQQMRTSDSNYTIPGRRVIRVVAGPTEGIASDKRNWRLLRADSC